MFIFIVLFIVFFVILKFLSKSGVEKAGKKGELLVSKRIKKIFGVKRYILKKNLVIPLYDGTTELDLLLITPKGLVSIEVKHYNGYLEGTLNSKMWIQYKNRKQKDFYNPYKQNTTHVNALTYQLKQNGVHLPIYNLVIFSSTAVPPFKHDDIITIKNLKKWIKKNIFQNKNEMINIKEINSVIDSFKLKTHIIDKSKSS